MSGTSIQPAGDLAVPAMGYGTFQLYGEDAYRGTRCALEVGYRHLDTAQGYDNEAEVGRALADSGVDREQVFITTKIKPSNAAASDVHASTRASLRELGIDRLDLLLLHWPAEDVAPLEETLEAMTELREAGLTRAIGVSNFPSAMLERAFALAPIVTDQVEHHPYLGVDAIRSVLTAHGGFVTAYSPLARGEVASDPVLVEIAAAHDATPAQVALRYLLDLPATVVIPKSADPERIESNLLALELDLTDADRERIAALERGRRFIDPEGAPDWD